MEIKELLQQAEERMNKSIEALKHEFASIRTGKALWWRWPRWPAIQRKTVLSA